MNSNTSFLLAEFMNLINACEQNGIEFEPVEGVSVTECRDTVNWYLANEGCSKAKIARLWSGEDQLTSS